MAKEWWQKSETGVSRRVFMKSGAMALVTMGLSPAFLRRSVYAQDLLKGAALHGNGRGKVLIVLFQRGAADALNVVVPHGEQAYYRMRPNIAIPRPVSASAQSAKCRPRKWTKSGRRSPAWRGRPSADCSQQRINKHRIS